MRREAGEDENEPFPPNPDLVRLNNVRRKPVGGGNDPPAPQQDPALRPSSASSQQRPVSPHPLPPEPVELVPDEHPGFQIPVDGPVPPPLPERPRRRPLPPVPPEEPFLDNTEGGHPVKGSNRWSALSGYLNGRGLENWKEKYEALANRRSLDSRPSNSAFAIPPNDRGSPGQSPTRRPYEGDSAGFHITLIRRDPTHGTQWNVATMSTPRLDGGPIDIEISTPGYNRFNAQDEPLNLASLGLNLPPDKRDSILSALKQPPEPTRTTHTGPRKFHRQLRASRPYPDDAAPDDPGSPTKPTFRLKSGYYTFVSPWNGICTFATSVNGRSLKCKHVIPSPTPMTNSPSSSSPPPNPAITAAEIRFNTPFQPGHLPLQPSPHHVSPFSLSQSQTLPLSSHHHQQQSSDSPPPTTSKRASVAQFLNPNIYSTRPRSRSNTGFVPTAPASGGPAYARSRSSTTQTQGSHRRSSSSMSSSADIEDQTQTHTQNQRPVDAEERMDLSLARENAGGGMRGKSAKLGKLVIEDEGIKMLDLVVAACMAVWWKGYYY